MKIRYSFSWVMLGLNVLAVFFLLYLNIVFFIFLDRSVEKFIIFLLDGIFVSILIYISFLGIGIVLIWRFLPGKWVVVGIISGLLGVCQMLCLPGMYEAFDPVVRLRVQAMVDLYEISNIMNTNLDERATTSQYIISENFQAWETELATQNVFAQNRMSKKPVLDVFSIAASPYKGIGLVSGNGDIKWIIISVGPDQDSDVLGEGVKSDDIARLIVEQGYDPSNGTISNGDIFYR